MAKSVLVDDETKITMAGYVDDGFGNLELAMTKSIGGTSGYSEF